VENKYKNMKHTKEAQNINNIFQIKLKRPLWSRRFWYQNSFEINLASVQGPEGAFVVTKLKCRHLQYDEYDSNRSRLSV